LKFIHSGYFYSASSRPLLLRGAPDYSINTVLELTRRSAISNCEWRTCPRSLHGGWSGIRNCDPPDARHPTCHWATTLHNISLRLQLSLELDTLQGASKWGGCHSHMQIHLCLTTDSTDIKIQGLIDYIIW